MRKINIFSKNKSILNWRRYTLVFLTFETLYHWLVYGSSSARFQNQNVLELDTVNRVVLHIYKRDYDDSDEQGSSVPIETFV